jgi:hypothetical protein
VDDFNCSQLNEKMEVTVFLFSTYNLEKRVRGTCLLMVSKLIKGVSIYKYSVPMISVWILYLIAFWPGIMVPDTFDQWNQFMVWRFNDWHPVFHTLMLWLFTRIHPSPAPVAIFQILALSFISSWGLYQFEYLGVRKYILWITSIIFAVAQVNSFMVNTLWKDVPYTILLVICTVLLTIIIQNKGVWLDRKGNCISLGIVLGLINLFRHNGFLVSLGVLLALFIVFRTYFRRMILVVSTYMIALLIVQMGLYSWLRVNRIQVVGITLLHPISAYVVSNQINALTTQETKFLDQIHPLKDGWKKYSCYEIGYLQYDPKTNLPLIINNPNMMIKILLKLIWSNPGIYFNHAICSSSYLWSIPHPKGSPQELIYIPSESYYQLFYWYTHHYKDQLEPAPISLPLNRLLSEIYYKSTSNEYLLIFWRPALYLYLYIIAIFVSTFVLRKPYYLIALPLIINTITMMIISPSSSIRYQYIAYVDALLFFLPLIALSSIKLWKR